MENTTEQILDFLNRNRRELIRFLIALVKAESPTTEPAAVEALFRQIGKAFEELDYHCLYRKGKTSAGQLLIRPNGRPEGPYQLLLGHCDTVWPVGTLREMPVEMHENILRGPGVYDMKAGIAQIFYSLRTLQALGLKPRVTPIVLLTSDEETGSAESAPLIMRLARIVNRALIPEPSTGSEGKLKTSRKGIGRFAISITGKPAHAGVEPERGVSAVVELSHVIQKLHALNNPGTGTTVNVGIVEGGSRVNIVPDTAWAQVDVRVETAEYGRQLEHAIRSLRPSLEGTTIQIRGGIERQPMEKTPRNTALWRAAVEAGRRIGLELGESHTGGGSDGNLTSLFTATLDGLGGVGGGAHAPHEFIYIDKLVERTALMAMLILADPIESAPEQAD